MISCIYTLSVNNKISYVGTTDCPEIRFNQHIRGYVKSPVSQLIRCCLEQGLNFHFDIIDFVDRRLKFDREKYHMNRFKKAGIKLLNFLPGYFEYNHLNRLNEALDYFTRIR